MSAVDFGTVAMDLEKVAWISVKFGMHVCRVAKAYEL